MSRRLITIVLFAVLVAAVVTALILPRGLGLGSTQALPASLEPVQMELVLLVDTSGSVDSSEYALQKGGYEEAFRSPSLVSAVEVRGGIAVLYVEWSDADHQSVRIDWTRLDDEADCVAYADRIRGIARSDEGSTEMAPAIQFAVDQIQSNRYAALRRIVDVSGDGRCKNYDYYLANADYSSDHGKPWDQVMTDIGGKVDQINGICITTSESVLDFYEDVLPQGVGGFALQTESFSGFSELILNKLLREIATIPPVYD